MKTVYEYQENTDFVEKITHLASDGVTVLSSVTYERYPGGEPKKIIREDGSYTEIGYDGSLRVEREYQYDSEGNLIDEVVYSYDADGNRQTVSGGVAEGVYDYENVHQLESIETASGKESYGYDGGVVWRQ